jgi:hypothetical protein
LCSVSLGSSGATAGVDRGGESPYPMRIRSHRSVELTFEELRVIEDQLRSVGARPLRINFPFPFDGAATLSGPP